MTDALPPRSRGVIALLEENCTVCMLCARECPDWCIHIESHVVVAEVAEVAEPGAGRRERTRNVLDRFAIDYALCLYCGICVDVCPFDALHWAPDSTYPAVDLVELTHERDVLRGWLQTAPPPPPLEPDAAPAKELTDADRYAERAASRGNAGGPPGR